MKRKWWRTAADVLCCVNAVVIVLGLWQPWFITRVAVAVWVVSLLAVRLMDQRLIDTQRDFIDKYATSKGLR